MRRPIRLPKYRHHKARDLAKVCIDGREIYLGRYNSPESLRKYDQLVGAWLATGKVGPNPPSGEMTVEQLANRYVLWAEDYSAPGKISTVRAAVKVLLLPSELDYSNPPLALAQFLPFPESTHRCPSGRCRRGRNGNLRQRSREGPIRRPEYAAT